MYLKFIFVFFLVISREAAVLGPFGKYSFKDVSFLPLFFSLSSGQAFPFPSFLSPPSDDAVFFQRNPCTRPKIFGSV